MKFRHKVLYKNFISAPTGLQSEDINNPLFSLVTKLFKETITSSLENEFKLLLKFPSNVSNPV